MDKQTRGRAWRRHQHRRNKPEHRTSVPSCHRVNVHGDKKWKLMYFRKNKLFRAKQLGTVYPPQNPIAELDYYD